MIRAGSGSGRARDPVDAGLDAALAAQERSGATDADLCLVFATPAAFAQAGPMLTVIHRAISARAVVGLSGAGVLTERGEHEDAGDGETAVAALVVQSDTLRIRPFLVDETGGLGSAAGTVAGGRAIEADMDDGLLVVLPDPVELNPDELLQGIGEVGSRLKVTGGVGAGGPAFELFNSQVARAALTGFAMDGVEPIIGVAQGCQPIGEPFVITRGDGRVVREIAGRPALEVLRRAIGELPDAERRLRTAGIFAGLAMDPAKSPLARGDFVVRGLVNADQGSGVVAVADSIHVGQTIQFQIRDAVAAAEDLATTLEGMAAALGGRRPAFGFYFNCAGRGRGLYGAPNHDVRMIRARLGAFPLVGFFGNGEFAPLGRRNFFHTYTGVLVVFPEAAAAESS
jgi:small ligand-binding sensory domain FIST